MIIFEDLQTYLDPNSNMIENIHTIWEEKANLTYFMLMVFYVTVSVKRVLATSPKNKRFKEVVRKLEEAQRLLNSNV